MQKVKQEEYAYATGLIRAKEIKLLDAARFERMLESPTPEEAYKVLTEADYGIGSDSLSNVYSFEALLDEEMKKTYALLEEISPQIEVLRAFQRRYDFFNVKVLLKAEFLNQEPPPILMDTGTIDLDYLKNVIRERDYKELSPILHQAILDIYDTFSRTADPQVIDLLLDKAEWQQFVSDLSSIESAFLHELARLMVDITNIKMYIRARTLNKAWDFIKKLFLDGGEISENIFFNNSDKAIDSFVDDIKNTKYGDAVIRGWEIYKTKKNLSGLEKFLDDFVMEFIRRAKLVTMGVEPYIAWLFAKETEIKNVRIIMTGKINGLPSDLIRERLRLGYV